MPDMQGKTVVVTGGNSGIGFETAAGPGVHGRPRPGDGAERRQGPGRRGGDHAALDGDGQVQLVVFDLADLASVRQGAAEILEQAPRLDVLVNNAGLVLTRACRDGGRLRGDVRHRTISGPFLLTNLLLERIDGVGAGSRS